MNLCEVFRQEAVVQLQAEQVQLREVSEELRAERNRHFATETAMGQLSQQHAVENGELMRALRLHERDIASLQRTSSALSAQLSELQAARAADTKEHQREVRTRLISSSLLIWGRMDQPSGRIGRLIFDNIKCKHDFLQATIFIDHNGLRWYIEETYQISY